MVFFFFFVCESELQLSYEGGQYLGLTVAGQARLNPELIVLTSYSAINQGGLANGGSGNSAILHGMR